MTLGSDSSPCCSPSSLPPRTDVSALVLAAGLGMRLGLGPKAFLRLGPRETLVQHAVAAVAPFAAEILVGVPPKEMERAHDLLDPLPHASTIIPGGATRQETVHLLLERATRPIILLHEMARPYVTADLFERVLCGAAVTGAAALSLPLEARDSVALVDANGHLDHALPRSRVVTLQVPHAYRRDILLDAHQKAKQNGWGEDGTANLVHRAGYAVNLVKGSRDNIKITHPGDLPPGCRPMDIAPRPTGTTP